jgi:His Kinase A (phospho-acceptor) domain
MSLCGSIRALSNMSGNESQRTVQMNAHGPITQTDALTAALDEANGTSVPAAFSIGDANQAMTSSIAEGEESDITTARCSHAGCGCADAAHEVANSLTAVLINTQVLEWKLPPYSRLKRTVREIERHAQRSGALLKDLLGRLAVNQARQEFCGQITSSHRTMAAVTAQGLVATDGGPAKLPPQPPSPTAPSLNLPPEKELTSTCDRCTSTFFPKEER